MDGDDDLLPPSVCVRFFFFFFAFVVFGAVNRSVKVVLGCHDRKELRRMGKGYGKGWEKYNATDEKAFGLLIFGRMTWR